MIKNLWISTVVLAAFISQIAMAEKSQLENKVFSSSSFQQSNVVSHSSMNEPSLETCQIAAINSLNFVAERLAKKLGDDNKSVISLRNPSQSRIDQSANRCMKEWNTEKNGLKWQCASKTYVASN